jgi:hypothetical protein
MSKSGFLPLLTLLATCFGADTARPVKLEVKLAASSVGVGERAAMTVQLLDAESRPVPAPKDFKVDIVARFPSNATETMASALLKAGESSLRVELPPATTEGFLYIWAKQPELRVGGAYLRIKPARAQKPTEVKKPTHTLAIPVAKLGQMKAELSKTRPSAAAAAEARPPAQPSPAPPAAAPGSGSGSGYLLALRYSPQRAFLGNGKDPVTVHAFVMSRSEAPLPGFRVRLFDGTGTMAPVPLVIPPGEEEGKATLTSNREGKIKVEYLGAMPAVDLDGDRVMTVDFEPPIVGFELQPSPPRISLLDGCDLVLQLIDDEGRPIATKTRRTISLALTSGRGEISAKEIPIDPDSSVARATFTPVWWGPVTVTASTPNLMNVSAAIEVAPPIGLLGFSLAGGLLGGYVFMLKRPKSKLWRVPLGALTGVILLWACLFLGIGVLPRAVILNPMSVFVISVIGGWLGTGVFEPILKRLGFEARAKTTVRTS